MIACKKETKPSLSRIDLANRISSELEFFTYEFQVYFVRVLTFSFISSFRNRENLLDKAQRTSDASRIRRHERSASSARVCERYAGKLAFNKLSGDGYPTHILGIHMLPPG